MLEVRDPIRGREVTALRHAHAPAIDPPPTGPDHQRAALADQPDAELAPMQGDPPALQEIALAMSHEVAE